MRACFSAQRTARLTRLLSYHSSIDTRKAFLHRSRRVYAHGKSQSKCYRGEKAVRPRGALFALVRFFWYDDAVFF